VDWRSVGEHVGSRCVWRREGERDAETARITTPLLRNGGPTMPGVCPVAQAHRVSSGGQVLRVCLPGHPLAVYLADVIALRVSGCQYASVAAVSLICGSHSWTEFVSHG
jgi:hypothetical protein